MPKLNRKELAHRADRLGLALWPLSQGGYKLCERLESGDPDFSKLVYGPKPAAGIADFLAGVVWVGGEEGES